MAVELSDDDRRNLAMAVMDILEDWRLKTDEQMHLLGLPEKTSPRLLGRYRRGTPFPQDDDLLDRAKHVLGIQESLHLLFPTNRRMSAFWVRNRNRSLKAAPLQVMLSEGLDGMHRVWRQLDCTLNWD